MKKAIFTLAFALVVVTAGARPYAYDVNKDGMINITDVTCLVNNILGVSNSGEDEQAFVYDVNYDGLVNVTDVTCLVNKILGGSNPNEEPASYLSCPDDNHPHMIDLGLPSGTKWACCNVGAETPVSYGGYYAWGETEEKDFYSWNEYTHCGGTGDTCEDLGGDISYTQYDVANVKWGDLWRMPSSGQISELLDNCVSEWTTVDGVKGRKFTGTNGGTIFLPAAGRRVLRGLNKAGEEAMYWSSEQASELSKACYLHLISRDASSDVYERYLGFTIRPVSIPLRLSKEAIELLVDSLGKIEITCGNGSYTVASSDEEVATAVVENAQITLTAKSLGQTVVTVTDVKSGQTLAIEVNVVRYLTCPDNHHPHMIDLGLPSGTKWACCNVDADKPETYGGYYAWGETEVKSFYDWSTYIHCDGNYKTCHDIGSDIAYTQYDVAHTKWGDAWEMPSALHYIEIFDNCTKEKTTVNGVKGMVYIGPNGNSIFLPAGGYINHYDYVGLGFDCDYWLSTCSSLYKGMARYMWADYTTDTVFYGNNYEGRLVRPIFRPSLSLSTSSLTIALNTQKAAEINIANGSYAVASSNEAIAMAEVEGTQVKVTAKGVGQAVITVTDVRRGQTATIDVTVVKYYTCPDNNHPHIIDLGLSKKWACCNVGASKPEDYGGYYAWGELAVKDNYNWSNYQHCDGTEESCHDIGYSIPDEYDVATVEWGFRWEIPSWNDLSELCNNSRCYSEKATENGVNGIRFIGRNGNSIFLPMAGRSSQNGPYKQGENGYYWSETRFESTSAYGLMLVYLSGSKEQFALSRCYGVSIRPAYW